MCSSASPARLDITPVACRRLPCIALVCTHIRTADAPSGSLRLEAADAETVQSQRLGKTIGSLDVAGTMNVSATVDVLGDVTLRDGATLNNTGRARYGGNFSNDGATITGSSPTPLP